MPLNQEVVGEVVEWLSNIEACDEETATDLKEAVRKIETGNPSLALEFIEGEIEGREESLQEEISATINDETQSFPAEDDISSEEIHIDRFRRWVRELKQ